MGYEGIRVETAQTICAVNIDFIRVGKVKGRNILKRAGFGQCQNPNYLQKGEQYAHYNSLNGTWILEGTR